MSFKLSNLQIPPPENGDQFEDLCLDLYKAEFGEKTQKYGRQGQSQEGIDIFVPDQYIGIQCKKKDLNDEIKESELKDEIQKAKTFKPLLKRFILATTCKRDAKIQKAARLISETHKNQNLLSVEIHSWGEIKPLFDKYPEVYEKYYLNSQKTSITPAIISSIQGESRHQKLNEIRDLINKDKPTTALELSETFEKKEWEQLEDKEKYRVLTNKAWAKLRMKKEIQASELFIKALKFNKEDENANANCALAYLIIGDIKTSKEYIEKTKQINPLNITAYILEVQAKDKEKQPLKDIVSAIPKNISLKYQIAHILAHTFIKRSQYKEAEKWLNNFYNAKEQNESRKNTMAEADYADMSLSLILSKQDILSGRRIPDNLKNKLKKIIKIYKKLVTDRQYNEIREFNSNWYLNYSLALELNGKLNEAIDILQKGIQNVTSNTYLKIELSRLFTEKRDIAKSISVLEELLGLQTETFEDTSDSANKKQFTSKQIDIPGESVNLFLILADLYFQNNQSEKAQKLLEKIQESPSINEDDLLEAKQYLIFRLIDFGKTDKAEKILDPLFKKDKDNIFTLILKSKIEDAKGKILERKGEDSKDHRDKKIQYLKKAYNIFKDKNYNKEVSQNNFYFETKERLRDIEQLSQELYYSKMYKETEPLLEEITNQNLNHPKIFDLLHIYFENGKNRLSIELAEALLKKFPDKIELVNILFLIYESLDNKAKAIQYYENFLKLHPENNLIRIELSLAYIQSEHISKAKQLLKNEFDLDRLSTEQMSRLSFAYMKTGSIQKSLETQYKCIKSNPKELEPQNVYFQLFTFLNHPGFTEMSNFKKESEKLESTEYKSNNKSFLHPDKVVLDCYIRYKNIESSEETGFIIEEDADIYTPNHELSKALLGKKAGNTFLFLDKKYQIMEIKSKYHHKYHEITKEAEKRFASKTFLKSAHIRKEADQEEILQALRRTAPDISKQQEGLNKLFQLYSEGKATIGSIAKLSNKHSVEIIGELIASPKDKFISSIPAWENESKKQEHLDSKTNILFDLSSLIMIHQLKIEEYIEKSKFNFYICQSTIDSLKEYIQKTALHSKDGLLTVGFDKEGNFRKNFIPSEIIKRDLNFWMKVKIWVEKNCRKKSISSDIVLSRKERQEREILLGKEFLDPVLATGNSFILLCEDAILRKFAEQEFSVLGIRLFDLIGYFERQVIIDNNQATKFKAQLVRLNQTYIPIDHNILLFLLKEAGYSVNDTGFQKGLFFLSPISHLPGVINVMTNFFIEIYQNPSLLPYNKQMITKELLDKASFDRRESPKQIAYQLFQLVQLRTQLLPILQNEVCGSIIEWLKRKIY